MSENLKNVKPGDVVEVFRELMKQVERGMVTSLSPGSDGLVVRWADGGWCGVAPSHPSLRVMEVSAPPVPEPSARWAVVALSGGGFAVRTDTDHVPWRVYADPADREDYEWGAWDALSADVVGVLFEGVDA